MESLPVTADAKILLKESRELCFCILVEFYWVPLTLKLSDLFISLFEMNNTMILPPCILNIIVVHL